MSDARYLYLVEVFRHPEWPASNSSNELETACTFGSSSRHFADACLAALAEANRYSGFPKVNICIERYGPEDD